MGRTESFLDGRITLHAGDCLEVLRTLTENSIDSVCCDPPYHLTSIVKRFGGKDAAPAKGNDAYKRASAGFMGQQWDGGDVAFRPETWAEVLRVLKPGGYLLAFSGTRTYHRMVCAIEDAGFEVRDMVSWLYGSGFPKSLDVSKQLDKAAGAEREVVGPRPNVHSRGDHSLHEGWKRPWMDDPEAIERSMMATAPATDAAREWAGWGTALKPSMEPICVARKPLSEGTVAANVLKWKTGAINIDACRVSADAPALEHQGRWPANTLHDGSEEVVGMFPETGAAGHFPKNTGGIGTDSGIYGDAKGRAQDERWTNDSGSAARFFYSSKADSNDRVGSKHPTVKPVDLMQYLVRLVTPPKGTVLDPFAGTGTTGEAAWREGFRAVLIEREEEYQVDIRRRMALCLAGPDERARESIKAKTKDKPVDAGPLFAMTDEAAE